MTTMRSALAALALFALACSSYKDDGESCPASTCSDHGTCTYKDTFPTCACAKGYAGLICGRCADGFHRDAADACVADGACATGTCAHGTCSVVGGEATCACEPGWTGLACDACAGGFHLEDGVCVLDMTCFATTCSGGGTCAVKDGRATCTCEAGRAGTWCAERNATCPENACGAHGACFDTDGVVRCACDPGYTGPACAQCAPGFRDPGDGTCLLSDTCTPSSCSFGGTCALANGLSSCTCDVGYTGETCEACATGHHRGAGWKCVPDETCGTSTCGGHGDCFASGGEARCRCGAGWAGFRCDTCAPGYHPATGGACELDAECLAFTCRQHGTCAVEGGVPTCACNTGFTGAHCETNVDDCVNSACGAGTCVDLVAENACLCPNGTWGTTCGSQP